MVVGGDFEDSSELVDLTFGGNPLPANCNEPSEAKANTESDCILPVTIYPLANYPTNVAYAAYTTLRGNSMPTICGGRQSEVDLLDGCYFYGEAGVWRKVGTMPEKRGNMGWLKMSEDELMLAGLC